MEAAEKTPRETPDAGTREGLTAAPASAGRFEPGPVDPDLGFIRELDRQSGGSLKRCFQCGTCSATCAVAPDRRPFPRKEMAWAAWGMKDHLLADPDVWLCFQCNDCSTRCPRGARPGDVLAAVRRECVLHYAVPRFLGRWVSQPQFIPLLLGIPAGLLALALRARDPLADALGISTRAGERIVYSYSSVFPHWLLNAFFALFTLLAVLAVLLGVTRFWRAMKSTAADRRRARGPTGSLLSTLKSVFAHDRFTLCTEDRRRLASHMCVFFGFLALCLVTLWVITARYNPLIQGEFIYPFSFWNPWKVLANLGGVALVAGCLLMVRDRLREDARVGAGTYFDWVLISELLLVAATGFITEVLHYLRLEPHRHIAYFVHLVFVLAVLIYLPYSKLAHLAYRTAAMVFAERVGRNGMTPAEPVPAGREAELERKDDVGESTRER